MSGSTTTPTTCVRPTRTWKAMCGPKWETRGTFRAARAGDGRSLPIGQLGSAGGDSGDGRGGCFGFAELDVPRGGELEVDPQIAGIVEVGPQPALHRCCELARDGQAQPDAARRRRS